MGNKESKGGRVTTEERMGGEGREKKDREGREGKMKLGNQKENVWGMQGRQGEVKKLIEGWQIRKKRGIQGSEGLERGSSPLHIQLSLKLDSFSQIIFADSFNALNKMNKKIYSEKQKTVEFWSS